MSNLMSEIYDLLDIHRLRTAPYHPQTDGQSERFMRTIKTMLRAFVNSNRNDWDVQLNRLTYAYNSAVHSTTKFTPFELMFGRPAKMPMDIFFKSPKFQLDLELTPGEYSANLLVKLKAAYEAVRKNRDSRMDKAKVYHDRDVRACKFVVGDYVLLLDQVTKKGECKKLGPKWKGPYRVVQVMSDNDYKIVTVHLVKNKVMIENCGRLKRYHGPVIEGPIAKPALSAKAAKAIKDAEAAKAAEPAVNRRSNRHQEAPLIHAAEEDDDDEDNGQPEPPSDDESDDQQEK